MWIMLAMHASKFFLSVIILVAAFVIAVPQAQAQTCLTVAVDTTTQATLGPSCASSAQAVCDSILADLSATTATNHVFNSEGGISPCTGGELPFRLEGNSAFDAAPSPGDLFTVEYSTGELNCFRRQASGNLLRAFVCNNGCGFVEDPADSSNNCPGTTVGGEDASSTLTGNTDGSLTLEITSTPSQGYTHTYQVTVPAGGSIGDVTVVGGNRPRISMTTSLPPGETKEVTMTRGEGDRVCVRDHSSAEFTAAGGSCRDDRVRLGDIADCPSFSTHTVSGDPGDGGDPVDGLHDIEICNDDVAATVTFRRLLHTVLEFLVDSDGDDVIDEEDLCPNTNLDGPIPTGRLRPGHMGDDRTIHGCNASQILECKPGQDSKEQRYGLSPGTQKVFNARVGWAATCDFE